MFKRVAALGAALLLAPAIGIATAGSATAGTDAPVRLSTDLPGQSMVTDIKAAVAKAMPGGRWEVTSAAAIPCYPIVFEHPSSPGIYSDPCSKSVATYYRGGTVASIRLAEEVKWSWVAAGSGVKINAVQTVARISDLSGDWAGLQVDSVNAGYFNGGGVINSCATCPANSGGGDDILVTTPWKFGVGCGNSATGHWAGDQVWNHARYSSRSNIGNLVTWDSGGGGSDITDYRTYSFESYYYFAPRSTC